MSTESRLPDRAGASVASGPLWAAGLLPATSQLRLQRAGSSLVEALSASTAADRYVCAHLAALHTAGAWLAVQQSLGVTRPRSRNAWVLLEASSVELTPWARFFAAGAAKRSAAEAGSPTAVTAHEAAALVEAADRFLATVEELLGVTPHPPPQPAVRAAS